MNKAVYLFSLICVLAFASCNSSTESDNDTAVEKMEDQAEEAADEMEEEAENNDTTAVQPVQ